MIFENEVLNRDGQDRQDNRRNDELRTLNDELKATGFSVHRSAF